MLRHEHINKLIEDYDGYAYPLLKELLELLDVTGDASILLEAIHDYVTEEDELMLGHISLQYKIEEREWVYNKLKRFLL